MVIVYKYIFWSKFEYYCWQCNKI